jgi:hypothetical protein
MHGHTQRFKMMTLVLLVASIGCGKGVRNRQAVFPSSAKQVSVRVGWIPARRKEPSPSISGGLAIDEREAVRVVAGGLPLSLSSKPGLRFGLR